MTAMHSDNSPQLAFRMGLHRVHVHITHQGRWHLVIYIQMLGHHGPTVPRRPPPLSWDAARCCVFLRVSEF